MGKRSRIQGVLACYVRATDARDGAGQGAPLGSSHHVLQDLSFALPDAGPAPSGRA